MLLHSGRLDHSVRFFSAHLVPTQHCLCQKRGGNAGTDGRIVLNAEHQRQKRGQRPQRRKNGSGKKQAPPRPEYGNCQYGQQHDRQNGSQKRAEVRIAKRHQGKVGIVAHPRRTVRVAKAQHRALRQKLQGKRRQRKKQTQDSFLQYSPPPFQISLKSVYQSFRTVSRLPTPQAQASAQASARRAARAASISAAVVR